MRYTSLGLSICAMAGLAQSLSAQTVNNEVEANDGKAAANAVVLSTTGDTIVGNSTGASTTTAGAASADYFRVKTAPAALAIYKHRLTITTSGTAGHTGTIRGLTQSGSVINLTSDGAASTTSTSTTPARMVQWYGFGREEELFYRVAGTSSTTADYTATYEREPVTVMDVGNVFEGSITIGNGAGNTMDTDVWVYDSEFQPIPDAGADNGNSLTRTFTPGVYYIAWAKYNLANNLPAPAGDFQGVVLDFPNAVSSSSTSNTANAGFVLTDPAGPQAFALALPPMEIQWVKMTVVAGTPALGACCLPSGLCMQAVQDRCTTAGGTFAGVGTACGASACPVASNTWVEFEDAGEVPAASQVTEGSGALNRIVGQLTVGQEVDMYKVRVTDAANFNATTATGTDYDTILSVFNAGGLGVAYNDDIVGGTVQSVIDSTLVAPAGNGEYYIAVSRYSRRPASGTALIFPTTTTGQLGPTGPGGANPVDAWVNTVTASAGPYVITLVGAEFASGGGPAPCYANCDQSTTAPVLNVADFTCFLQRFAAGDSYANCDQSTTAPTLNVADFTCFLQGFAAGCP